MCVQLLWAYIIPSLSLGSCIESFDKTHPVSTNKTQYVLYFSGLTTKTISK